MPRGHPRMLGLHVGIDYARWQGHLHLLLYIMHLLQLHLLVGSKHNLLMVMVQGGVLLRCGHKLLL